MKSLFTFQFIVVACISSYAEPKIPAGSIVNAEEIIQLTPG